MLAELYHKKDSRTFRKRFRIEHLPLCGCVCLANRFSNDDDEFCFLLPCGAYKGIALTSGRLYGTVGSSTEGRKSLLLMTVHWAASLRLEILCSLGLLAIMSGVRFF